jgi:hypothetical protein
MGNPKERMPASIALRAFKRATQFQSDAGSLAESSGRIMLSGMANEKWAMQRGR